MSTPMPVTRLYTIAEAAEITRMSEYWLREQCREARLAHHRLGRCYRFAEADLLALMAASRVEPTGSALTPTRKIRR